MGGVDRYSGVSDILVELSKIAKDGFRNGKVIQMNILEIFEKENPNGNIKHQRCKQKF